MYDFTYTKGWIRFNKSNFYQFQPKIWVLHLTTFFCSHFKKVFFLCTIFFYHLCDRLQTYRFTRLDPGDYFVLFKKSFFLCPLWHSSKIWYFKFDLHWAVNIWSMLYVIRIEIRKYWQSNKLKCCFSSSFA